MYQHHIWSRRIEEDNLSKFNEKFIKDYDENSDKENISE